MANSFGGVGKVNRSTAFVSVFCSCLGVFFLLWLTPSTLDSYNVWSTLNSSGANAVTLVILLGLAFIVSGLIVGNLFLKACKLAHTGGLRRIVKIFVVFDVIAVVIAVLLIPANLTCKSFNFLSSESGSPSCSIAIIGDLVIFMPYVIIHEMTDDK